MNSDQDGRDDPQLLQLESQAQTLINTQRELSKVKDDLGQATQTIGQLFLEKQQSQQRIRALEKQVDELGARPEGGQPTTSPSSVDQDKLLAYSRELKHTRAELKSSEEERKRLEEVVDKHERELSGLHQELEQIKCLSNRRGKELAGTMVFLRKADSASITEIVEKVVSLNEEISRAAAILGASLEYEDPLGAVATKAYSLARATARSYIGEKLGDILYKESRNRTESYPNTLLVQVLLRIFLVMFCSGIIQSWSPNDPGSAKDLAAVYNKIKNKEDQQVAGRWRSLTRSYTRPAIESWEKELLEGLGCVLRIAGCRWIHAIEQHTSYKKMLDGVFTATQSLRNTLGEDFTSADLDISVLDFDQVFEPHYMEDYFGDAGQKTTEKRDAREVIVGTVGIGLKKATTERLANGEVLYQNVLSAQVALESTIVQALTQPPPPRKAKGKKPTNHRNMG